ncbi:MAG TPA: DsbA family protein [Blastocatellia bacterium]|nr:DsbA family protein [Blastocatellia bacterium]HMZ18980.1 DsbA family protein [Blastocatellia bacterium]HNG32465.1 DsbA family protein [Blastocatellia bacterium]
MSIVIQAFSDYVCPYCYLGETILQRAAAATGAEVVRRAYQLSESGAPPLDAQRLNAAWENTIYPTAAKLGVEIRQPSHSPSTRQAHEAAAWARRQGCFEGFHTKLFRSYFLEDKDLGELSVLKEIAWQSGLNPAELEKVLAEGRTAEDIDEDLLIAQTYGINFVPTFVVSGHLLRGVQEEAMLIKVIELASEGKLDAETRKLPHLPVTITRG